MLIIGCDYHPSFQQIAFVDRETGECGERKLTHKEEAESFYRDLNGRSVRVGMEATGHARWFERLLAEQNFELWIGVVRYRVCKAGWKREAVKNSESDIDGFGKNQITQED